MDTDKYLDHEEIKQLRHAVEREALADKAQGRTYWRKAWLLIDILTSTGCRASEARKITIGNIHFGQKPTIRVCGKGKNGGRWRTVRIPGELASHIKEYVGLKEILGEPIGKADYLFTATRGPARRGGKPYPTLQAVQGMFKKCAKVAGLERDYTIHSTRHGFGFMLYDRHKDLRLTQQMLGHASPTVTAIYAHVSPEKVDAAVEGLWD